MQYNIKEFVRVSNILKDTWKIQIDFWLILKIAANLVRTHSPKIFLNK